MSIDPAPGIRPARPRATPLARVADRFDLTSADALTRLEVTGVAMSTRDVVAGDLYVGVPGARRHGAEFAERARESGAVAMLTDAAGAEIASAVDLPVLVTRDPVREILGDVAAFVFGTDEFSALTFGVTGTNGKTSVVYLLDILLRAAGLKTGLSSTAERRVGESVVTSTLTSPESPELHGLLARMSEEGIEAVSLEVSAHATARRRIDGVTFDVVAFNNFSQDHLDDFGDLETYFAAKQQLFAPEHARRGVVVVDSPYGVRMARESRIPVVTLATEYGHEADWHMAITRQDLEGVSFVLQGPGSVRFTGRVPVFGRFMAENAALALIMLHEAGISVERVAAGLDRGLIPVYIPGRLERVSAEGSGPHFYVDYGHTPGSFTAMLDALDEVATGRIIFMFGADGDRDTTKREEMGRIAAAGADVLIICDYHPRTEDPSDIRAQLIAGAQLGGRAEIMEVPDPRAAIRTAVSLAGPEDVILYAGPGHEDYQEVDGQQLPYSAREEVRGALREAGLLS